MTEYLANMIFLRTQNLILRTHFVVSVSCLQGVNVLVATPVKIEHPVIPIMPYGEYRARIQANYLGIAHPNVCLAADALVIPKI